MSLYITLGAGTSNSRAVLWREDKVLSEVRTPVGVRETAITGSSESLSRAITGCIAGVCLKAGIAPEAVDVVLASGMITSNLGLKEIPHLVAPAGLDDLAEHMVSDSFPAVWHKPIWFIPGVKNKQGRVEADDLPQMDMMRGEEVEAVALIERLDIKGPCWFILPGSHSKFVRISKNGRIAHSVSTIGGELLDVLSRHTILAASVDTASPPSPKWLAKGYHVALEYGVSRAAYCVRLGQLWSDCTVADRSAYLMGAVLADDILAIKASGAAKDPIYVAGRDELREAFILLLHSDPEFKQVHAVEPELLTHLAGWGASLIARKRGLINAF